jgi:tetratricopeptide (TPR) repeat protein
MNKFKQKNIDSAARSRFLKTFSWTFPFIAILGFAIGNFIYGSFLLGLIIGVIAGLLTSIIVYAIVEYLGSSTVNLFYGMRRPVWSNLEKFEGQLNQSRNHKSKNEYHKALILVNDILKEVPDLPEALYLKAQILWEGYQKAAPAKNLLERILEVLPNRQETYNRWAQSLIDEINNVQQ